MKIYWEKLRTTQLEDWQIVVITIAIVLIRDMCR